MFNWFWEFLYGLVKVAFYCIDFILEIAQMLCGIKPVTVSTADGKSKETDILYHFLASEEITNAFIIVVVVGFILLFLFTAFAILRSQVKDGEGKTPARICFNSAKTLLYFLMVPGIMLLASVFVSTVMGVLFEATSLGEGSLGASLFTIIAEEAYTGDGNVQTILDGYLDGTYDYYSTTQVQSHFDLSEMNYFLGFVGGVSILILLALSMLSFVDRIISLVVLYIIAPISMSTSALDDGARFKLWRDTVINKFLSAFGALICLNVFVLMLSVIREIEFFDSNFMNALARLFFTLGGAFACYKGTAMIGNLVNSGAGSQDLQDRAFANGMFGRVMGMAAVGGKMLLKPLTGAASKAGRSIQGKASAAIHRDSNAKREVKAAMARDKYTEKYKAKSGQEQKIRETLQKGSQSPLGKTNNIAPPNQSAPTPIPVSGYAPDGPMGRYSSGNHESANQANQTIKDAMPDLHDDDEGKGK
ncbi:MAG: hypothetical protein IKA20_05620 [Clostridia bacterium]|nr:hypothetical protein [Clostridia bacterium]